jgi:hypothetical protein
MRRVGVVVAAALGLCVAVGAANAAPAPSLKVTACVLATGGQPQLVVTQTYRNGPATFGGAWVDSFAFYNAGVYEQTVNRDYLANLGDLASGTQTDTFNFFVGAASWNDYTRVEVAFVANAATLFRADVFQPKNGWRACR